MSLVCQKMFATRENVSGGSPDLVSTCVFLRNHTRPACPRSENHAPVGKETLVSGLPRGSPKLLWEANAQPKLSARGKLDEQAELEDKLSDGLLMTDIRRFGRE